MNDRALPVVPAPRGRGAAGNPKNRFERLHLETDMEVLAGREAVPTHFYRDPSRSAITRNDSPDVGFEFSLNPYRGCEHGCIYCYARPTHEYLGWSAGLDFESRILVKENAPELLRAELAAPRWKPATIAVSGVTDPYQPAERSFEITRRCLEVLAEFRNPVSIITKNHLVTRDVDILREMASYSTGKGEPLHHLARPDAAIPHGAANRHPRTTAGGGAHADGGGHSSGGDGGAGHPGADRP